MVKVLNYDRKGQPIEDLSKVTVHLDEFPIICREAARIATELAKEESA